MNASKRKSMDRIEQQFFGLLSLASRARQLECGEPQARKAVSANMAVMVLIDGDMSEGSRKKVINNGLFYGVPVYEVSAGHLGAAIGRNCMCCAVRRGELGNQLAKKVVENEFEHIHRT